jgi:hypothetical protein
VTLEREIELLREVALRAEFTLLEQRREFHRGEIGDLDELEDALNAWKAESAQTEKA